MHRYTLPLEFKRVGTAGELSGYGATFHDVDSYGDKIASGAFSRSLAEMRNGGRWPSMLWSHDPSEPVGVWSDLQEDATGLKISGQLNLATQRGAEARALAKQGALALSIGFRTRKASHDADGHRVLQDIELFEVSLVAMPANTNARIIEVKSSEGNVSMKSEHRILFEHWLRDPMGAPAQALAFFGQLRKDITAGTDAAGGFAVPVDLAREIDVQVAVSNPFRFLHGAQRLATSERHRMPLGSRGSGAAWATSDTAPRSDADGTPRFADRSPVFGELYARPEITSWALEDIAPEMTEWLSQVAADDLGALEAQSVVRGDGIGKIRGFLTTAPRLEPDDSSPTPDANSLQYFDGSANLIDALIDTVAAVRPGYRQVPTTGWVFSPTGLGAVRKAQDAALKSVLIEASAPGNPPMLLSHPAYECEAMDEPAGVTSPPGPLAFPAVFGNVRRGFSIVDRTAIRVGIDAVTQPSMVTFWIRRRTGGNVLDHRALKLVSF